MAAIGFAGGIPIGLSNDTSLISDYSRAIEGLVITGGAFDINPELFGDAYISPFSTLKVKRTEFELDVTRACLERNIPILGICGGAQLLAVALGGTLIQHIPDCPFDTLQHEQINPRNEPGHQVKIQTGTLLHEIINMKTLSVNSAHHQAVLNPGPKGIINASAPDTIIEGVEYPSYRFCVGVQWHPEFHISSGDKKLFRAFIESCKSKNS